ncbi:MAG TPA: hypothetical protein VIU11_21130 [Nakamurella sp.]
MAVTLLVVGSVGILLVWFGLGGDRTGHVHAGEASSVIAGAVPGAASTSAAMASSGSASTAGANEHAAHADAAPTTAPADPPAGTAPDAAAEPEDPDAAAADRRQISLAEAAGDGSVPSTTAAVVPVADKWLDPGAAGVNEGTKQQAAGVDLAPAPVVDPSDVLPNGLVNGCVAGYGRGVQCLPKTPPGHAGHGSGQDMSVYCTCAQARTLLPDGITVDAAGADPLGLDSNRDGTACGAGDR